MALDIDTFDNLRGGNALYKALAHPHAAVPARGLVAALAAAGPTAIVDPDGAAAGFAAMYALDGVDIAGVYVQDAARIGTPVLGHRGRPLADLAECRAGAVLVAAFDAKRLIGQLQPLLPRGARVLSLDAMRLPEVRLTNRARYLDPLNFATNFALFRDTGALHTRLVTANYWPTYGAAATTCWLTLFDADGAVIADWREACDRPGGALVIDSRDVRRRFDLGDFVGQLFIHVSGAAGHDVVKYALDTFGDVGGETSPADGGLSCTHDANAWPAERYAGLPAPVPGERVILWLQNSHPVPVPPGAIGLNPMGEERIAWLPEAIAPFASCAVDVAEMLPGLAWPRQIEVRAGKHVVRPRYEIVGAERRRRIAHVNVERGDLKPDPALPQLGAVLGKGYLLPAPILPPAEWLSELLPTPMTTAQAELPVAALVFDADGGELARVPLGRLPRDHATVVALDAVAAGLGDAHGHVELVYDFAHGGGDGWLHALFRYRHRASGHAAETSFGAHVFNTLTVYKDEPQAYSGRPPGLSTRLFLRLGDEPYDTLCQLIYPASLPWRPVSATALILHDRDGGEVARAALAIPCSGSRQFRYHALFDAATRRRAGAGAYIVVRDTTCRLFGYHGLIGAAGAFSLDHMFGF